MAQVLDPTTLRIGEENDYTLHAFCDLLKHWKSSDGTSDAQLPPPEAVRAFEFFVSILYETQDNRDSEDYGMNLAHMDEVWSVGDFDPDDDEYIKCITDAFPIVAEVLRSMTSLERLMWGAPLPMMWGIDDAIVSLPKLRDLHINLMTYWTLDMRCLHRLLHLSSISLEIGYLYVYSPSEDEASLSSLASTWPDFDYEQGSALDHDEACSAHAVWLASCTRLRALRTTEYKLFDPLVAGQPGVLATLCNVDVELLPPNPHLEEHRLGARSHALAAQALRIELLARATPQGKVTTGSVQEVAQVEVMQPYREVLLQDEIAQSIVDVFRVNRE